MKSEKFVVYLASKYAITGSSTPNECSFNVGSIYDNAPNWHRWADSDYCMIKLKNFSIKRTSAQLKTLGVANILVHTNTNLPNSLSNLDANKINTGSAGGVNNLSSSQILASIPANIDTHTYDGNDYFPESVKCSNPFKGTLQVVLTNEDGAEIALTSGMDWYMTICIYFADEPALLNY